MSAIQHLITEHLDIWTAADTGPKSGRGRSAANAAKVYGVSKLRELILELAVRGKLVPQNASDEPASELLKRIQAEKGRLIAEGKIKKDKPLPAIKDEEVPFFLPQGWEWARLPDIYYPISVSANKLLSSEINEAGKFPVVDQGQRYIAGYTDNHDLLISLPGPVVIFGDHTTARKLVDFDFVAGADGVKILRPLLQNEKFFWWQLVGFKLEGRGYARHFKILNECLYALPPLPEQVRIVAKVDELMAMCDQLEFEHNNATEAHEKLVSHLLGTLTQSQSAEDFSASWQRIATHFDTLFTTEASIDALKQTLLQIAVMGKLVPQDPNDEPASELLKRIRAEKARLIAEGKIKQEKPLVAIARDNRLVDLPAGWSGVYLTEVLALITDGDHQPPPKADAGVPFLVIGNLNTGVVNFSGCRIVPRKYYDDLDWGRKPKSGDILYTVTGSYGIPIPVERDQEFCVQRHVAILKATRSSPTRYLALMLGSKYAKDYARDVATGIAQKTVPLTGLRKMHVPLPPLEEQHRIVAKVDELMTLCDQLKSCLTAASQLQQALANVLVEKAVA